MVELIIYGLILVAAIYIFVYIVIPAVLAIGGIATMIISVTAFGVGLVSALINYVSAIRQNINFIHWEWEKGDQPAKRSYFFGPGYAQLLGTIKTAFALNKKSIAKARGMAENIRGFDDGFWGFMRKLGALLFKAISYLCIYGIGTALCAGLAAIHGTITTAIMIITYIIFSIVWLVDRIYLMKNKIRSDCPTCHTPYLIPTFMCPDCGAMHTKLVPGPYGIWKRKCNCGNKLSVTFLNGRSKLEAYCPECGTPLVASDARPIVFQLIGGSNSGKTVFLASFFHEYLKKLKENNNVEHTIIDQYQPYFDELEEWYSGVSCPATAQLNSQMYPILIDSQLGVKRQLSVYDIAGEMFDGYTADNEMLQQQFHYCNGLLFLLDPFSEGVLRKNKENAGEDMSDYSKMEAEKVVTNFINYFISTRHAKAGSRCDIPLAVLIAKSDIKEVKKEIGPAKIASVFRNNQEQYETNEAARDDVCRQFLIDIGLSTVVDDLETLFTNVHYFPISAMGHPADGTKYEPWGIMDAVEWMLPLADKEMADIINPPAVIQTN